MSPASQHLSLEWIGIDVSKDKLDVYDLNNQAYTLFKNNDEGIEALTKMLLTRSKAAVVCEATGGYESAMAQRLHQLGIRVSVVNPRPVRDLARALSKAS